MTMQLSLQAIITCRVRVIVHLRDEERFVTDMRVISVISRSDDPRRWNVLEDSEPH